MRLFICNDSIIIAHCTRYVMEEPPAYESMYYRRIQMYAHTHLNGHQASKNPLSVANAAAGAVLQGESEAVPTSLEGK
jgi:hypothetical protein